MQESITDNVAKCFGDIVFPWLVEHEFLCRIGRPNKYQLSLYRRYLELAGMVKK